VIGTARTRALGEQAAHDGRRADDQEHRARQTRHRMSTDVEHVGSDRDGTIEKRGLSKS